MHFVFGAAPAQDVAAALRELRARSTLSLGNLAARTAYSKSSWERYLNGKTLPPRRAVQDLCRLAGEPDGRFVALWEIAESEWSGRAAGVTRADPHPQPTRRQRPSPSSAPPTTLPRDGIRAGRRGTAAVVAVVLASACSVAARGVVTATS